MPNGEEPGADAPTDKETLLQEQLRSKNEQLESKDELLRAKDEQLRSEAAQVDRLRGKLDAAETARDSARQELGVEKARAEEAGNARRAAEEKAASAREEAGKYKARLDADNSAKRLLEAEQDARRGLRDFVQQSLTDILAGVDAAAMDARERQLDGGLEESGFMTPGRVGFPSGSGRDSIVEFDLAVVAGKQRIDEETGSEEAEAKAKVSFMDVIPLGFSAEARAGVRSERRSEERSDLTRHNRIRFSVPVTFASLDDPTG